jgi:hypothetical protein
MNHARDVRCDDSKGADLVCAAHGLRTIGKPLAQLQEVYERRIDMHSLPRTSLQHDR